MPGHSEPAFQPSATSASLLSSSSNLPGLYSDGRATPIADPSPCDDLGLPSEGASRLHPENMDLESEAHPAGSDAHNLQQAVEGDFGFGASRSTLSDEALSAFMSVPHYPNAPINRTRISISEIVNAVIEPGDFYHHQSASIQETPEPHSSPLQDLYMSDSEMTDALSDIGGAPLNNYQMERMGIADYVSHFVYEASAQDNYTAADDTEEDSGTDFLMDDEPHQPRREPISFGILEDDDDMRKFYMDHGDSENDADSHYVISDSSSSRLSEIDLDEFYRTPGDTYNSQEAVFEPPSTHEDHTNSFSDTEDTTGDPAADPHFAESVLLHTTQERNLNIDQFISQWLYESSTASIPMLSPTPPVSSQSPLSNIIRWALPAKIVRPSRYNGEFYDIQQIPWWEKLRVKRSDARLLRDQCYEPYNNLQHMRHRRGPTLPEGEFYFQGKSMYTSHKATIEHFQLRNLMSVPAYNTVHFAHESKLYSWVPAYDDLQCLIDLSKPTAESGFKCPVKISTMKTAVGVSIVGGFYGEYAVRAMGAEDKGIQGYVTKEENGITNHIDIIPSRSTRSPIGVFASNDCHIRTLDCETNTFLTDHKLARAVNCTSTSPDGRLRVVIGDLPEAWVVEADTGRPIYPLRGHRDFGFACAWSPDMMQIATSNQDKSAIIWDVRTWRPLEKIESDVAGYRSLRFSPVGGGPRTLLLCEPADRLVLVNAQTYKTRQVHDFFGEVGGADYSPDGSTIWAANTDEHFGGFMEYDRRQWGQPYESQSPNEWVKESDLDQDGRCLFSERERQSRSLWNHSDEEHDELLVY
ncbi:hypothetical protein BJY04DRAFT_184425 [Aspergillus karnatakaensis]|uniref:WD40 repeat domain-containing protein n=1 Tax=Aspergillus karnatakaensis TaxID=1810916 RepID=UPI003CCD8FB9